MQMQVISENKRLRADVDGLRYEATVTTAPNGNLRIDSGTVSDLETGMPLADFHSNAGSTYYSFSNCDSERRLSLVQSIENLIAQLSTNNQ